MHHYHGTPCGATRQDVSRFLAGRHAFISFHRPEDLGTAAEVCQSFAIDNGAYSAWRSGQAITDWQPYYDFVEEWHRHPAFDWAIIPDTITGTEADNDVYLEDWPSHLEGVPVWHMHETLERLQRLLTWPRIAIGSSGGFQTVGTPSWWRRMTDAMEIICTNGRPNTRLHGLRMLDPMVFNKLPLASADSTNAVRNSSNFSRFGQYCPPYASTRMSINAERIEAHQSAGTWTGHPDTGQYTLFG